MKQSHGELYVQVDGPDPEAELATRTTADPLPISGQWQNAEHDKQA